MLKSDQRIILTSTDSEYLGLKGLGILHTDGSKVEFYRERYAQLVDEAIAFVKSRIPSQADRQFGTQFSAALFSFLRDEKRMIYARSNGTEALAERNTYDCWSSSLFGYDAARGLGIKAGIVELIFHDHQILELTTPLGNLYVETTSGNVYPENIFHGRYPSGALFFRDPQSIQGCYWQTRGIAHQEDPSDPNNLDMALECYDDAIKISSQLVTAWNNRGMILCDRQQFDEAESSYRQAMSIVQKNPNVLSNLLTLHLRWGRFNQEADYADVQFHFEEALRYGTMAHESLSDLHTAGIKYAMPILWSNLGDVNWQLAATCEEQANRIDYISAALNWYEKFSATIRDDNRLREEVSMKIGNALNALDRTDEARAYFETALALNPGNMMARFQLDGQLVLLA